MIQTTDSAAEIMANPSWHAADYSYVRASQAQGVRNQVLAVGQRFGARLRDTSEVSAEHRKDFDNAVSVLTQWLAGGTEGDWAKEAEAFGPMLKALHAVGWTDYAEITNSARGVYAQINSHVEALLQRPPQLTEEALKGYASDREFKVGEGEIYDAQRDLLDIAQGAELSGQAKATLAEVSILLSDATMVPDGGPAGAISRYGQVGKSLAALRASSPEKVGEAADRMAQRIERHRGQLYEGLQDEGGTRVRAVFAKVMKRRQRLFQSFSEQNGAVQANGKIARLYGKIQEVSGWSEMTASRGSARSFQAAMMSAQEASSGDKPNEIVLAFTALAGKANEFIRDLEETPPPSGQRSVETVLKALRPAAVQFAVQMHATALAGTWPAAFGSDPPGIHAARPVRTSLSSASGRAATAALAAPHGARGKARPGQGKLASKAAPGRPGASQNKVAEPPGR